MDEKTLQHLKWLATYGEFWLGIIDEQPLSTDRELYISLSKLDEGIVVNLRIGKTDIIGVPFSALEYVLSLAQYVGEQDGELGVAA